MTGTTTGLRRAIVPALILLSSWAPVRPARAALDAGRPACDYCRMIFTRRDFGGEIRTRTGERKIYDSIECLAAVVLTDSVRQEQIRAIAVIDFAKPHARVSVERAVFLRSPTLESPMGLSFAAFGTRSAAAAARRKYPGTLMDWRGVLDRVNELWFKRTLSVKTHLRTGARASPGR